MRVVFSLILALLVAGILGAGGFPTARPSGVVFVAGGAGGQDVFAEVVRELAREQGLPVRVVEVPWGSTDAVADMLDQERQHAWGAKLAQQIQTVHKTNPRSSIYLLGYSSGAGVMLAAASFSFPHIIRRTILLAPGVSNRYDLRPALERSHAIDVFYSNNDNFQAILSDKIGTSDQGKVPKAGQFGFSVYGHNPTDVALYRRLRQHRWDAAMESTGHPGGHFGYTRQRFLCVYVLPLLSNPP